MNLHVTLQNLNINRPDLAELIELYTSAKALANTYIDLGVKTPSYVTNALTALKQAIIVKTREEKQRELALLQHNYYQRMPNKDKQQLTANRINELAAELGVDVNSLNLPGLTPNQDSTSEE